MQFPSSQSKLTTAGSNASVIRPPVFDTLQLSLQFEAFPGASTTLHWATTKRPHLIEGRSLRSHRDVVSRLSAADYAGSTTASTNRGGALDSFNLAVRFLLELVAIGALAYWGFRTPSATPAKVTLAIVAPLVLIVVWALVVAPGANNPLSPSTRMLIGSVLLLLSAAALAAVDQARVGIIVAIVTVLNTVLMLVFPATPAT